MLSMVQSNSERAHLLNRIFQLLMSFKTMPFFCDLVISIQSTLVNNIEKCMDSDSINEIRSNIESLLSHLPDAESKTLFTQTLNKFPTLK